MRKLILTLGFGLLAIWGVFGIYWGISAGINPQSSMDMTLKMAEVVQSSYFIPGFLIYTALMMGAAFSPLFTNFFKNIKKKKYLMQVGQKATAKILAMENTGIIINNNPYIKMTVEVKSGIHATFNTTISYFNPLRVGDSVEVLYDPANPSEAMLVK